MIKKSRRLSGNKKVNKKIQKNTENDRKMKSKNKKE